ncbi:MAG: LamG domain-containing protein, partial [Flavobacteriales bacterium]|nr:LamG domain-containing protein [Flavobacteriales bacterium]
MRERTERIRVHLLSIFICLSLTGFAQERVNDGLLSLYNFQNVSGAYVHDISGVGTPMMLKIEDTEVTEWMSGGGLSINGPTKIRSFTPASKITDGIVATGALTMEAWISPANTNQEGPARIMSVSYGTSNRNMMLGQEGHEYAARVRTSTTSNNGTPDFLSATNSAQSTLQHVIYTLDIDGNESFFINGELVSTGSRTGDIEGWDTDYSLVLANEIDAFRAWMGEMYLVAVYDKALSAEEVVQNFQAGHLIEGPELSTQTCAGEDCWINGFGVDARALWLPNLPNNVYKKFKFDENGGHFDVFADGTAHLYGQTENMMDPSYGLYIDVWLTDRMNWDEWSALGRGWKGNPNIVGDLYQTWDYFIMDPAKENVLVGVDNYEGSLLNLTHKPSDYNYGFQLGQAANDQNGEEGISCWFYYSGMLDGQFLEQNGDINLEGACNNLPVLECAVDVTVDCVEGTDPNVTGEPVVNCDDEYTLTYTDEILEGECPQVIIRHWVATNTAGDEVICDQTITMADHTAPDIAIVSNVTYDCDFTPESMILVSDLCSPWIDIEVNTLDSAWYSGESCESGQLRTQTMGGWGATPNGNNPGVYLHENFDNAFPNGLTIGCGGNTLTFTSAQAITDFLPSGSTASPLPAGHMVDPGDAYNNVLAGQLVAATLSTTFDAYDPNFGESEWALQDLTILSGDYQGTQVAMLLEEGNQLIGGCAGTNYSAVNDALSSINENYVDGEMNGGFLGCDAPWDCYLQFQYEVVATDNCGNTATETFTAYFVDETPIELPAMEEHLTVDCGEIPDPSLDLETGCTFQSTTLEVSDLEFSGACYPTIQRTWHLTDQCGNDTTFVQYITV